MLPTLMSCGVPMGAATKREGSWLKRLRSLPRMLSDNPPFWPIQSRPNGKPLQGRRARISSLILRI